MPSEQARDGDGQFLASLDTVMQDQRAAELRSSSFTYRQIADQLGIAVGTAYNAVQRGMQAVPTEGQIEAKRLELLKLDRRERNMLTLSLDTSLDPEQRVRADSALDRVAKRRAALMGLDAPQQIRVTTVTEDEVDAEIRRLEAKLSQNDSKESVEP